MADLPARGRAVIQPDELVVGRLASWSIRYEAGRTILPGGGIRIRPYGNPLVRPVGQTYMPGSPNYVGLRCEARASVELSCTPWLVVTATVKEGRLAPGDRLEIVYGDMSAGCPGFQLRAIAFRLRFRLSVKYSESDEPVALPERPALHLIPDEPAKYLLYAPSILSGGLPAAARVRRLITITCGSRSKTTRWPGLRRSGSRSDLDQKRHDDVPKGCRNHFSGLFRVAHENFALTPSWTKPLFEGLPDEEPLSEEVPGKEPSFSESSTSPPPGVVLPLLPLSGVPSFGGSSRKGD